MKFTKPALTFEQQADRLLERGLMADREVLLRRLNATSYFRLSSCAWPYLEGERYREGTTLDQVWRLYTFDHRLRTLFIDAIESIEVQVRTQLAYHFSHAHGPFAYLEPGNLPNFDEDEDDFKKWRRKIQGQLKRSIDPKGAESFAVNFFRDHGDSHDLLPVWMMIELMDFGATLSFFRGVSIDIRKAIAATVGQPEEVVLSWFLGLHIIRNRCAHHARLWNWRSGTSVKHPNKRKHPEWWQPPMPGNQMGMMLSICRYWLRRTSPGHTWDTRARALFETYPEVPVRNMGLPDGWQEHPLWKS